MQQLILGTGTAIWWLTEPHCMRIIRHFSKFPDLSRKVKIVLGQCRKNIDITTGYKAIKTCHGCNL